MNRRTCETFNFKKWTLPQLQATGSRQPEPSLRAPLTVSPIPTASQSASRAPSDRPPLCDSAHAPPRHRHPAPSPARRRPACSPSPPDAVPARTHDDSGAPVAGAPVPQKAAARDRARGEDRPARHLGVGRRRGPLEHPGCEFSRARAQRLASETAARRLWCGLSVDLGSSDCGRRRPSTPRPALFAPAASFARAESDAPVDRGLDLVVAPLTFKSCQARSPRRRRAR